MNACLYVFYAFLNYSTDFDKIVCEVILDLEKDIGNFLS